MRKLFLNWFAVPVLGGNDDRKHRIRLLSLMVNSGLVFIGLLFLVNLLDPSTPIRNYLIDLLIFLAFLASWRELRHGRTALVGIGILAAGFILITAALVSEGTIRTPVVANLILVILVAGILFELKGILVSILLCSLVVLGVILTERAALLPSPRHSATIVEWLVLTLTFSITGALSYFTHQITLDAFRRSRREIREREYAEGEMKKLLQAVEQSPASIVITDLAGQIEYVNPRFCQTTGYSPAEVIGKNPRLLKTDQTPPETHIQLWEKLSSGQEWQGEFVNQRKDGTVYYEYAVISCIFNPNSVVTHYLAVKEDITKRKQIETALKTANEELSSRVVEVEKLHVELREQALRDPLTGLHNRRYLSETLPREIARIEREKTCLSILIADVDHFKMINDTYGHQVGDLFLVKIAELIKNCMRGSDIICRYGGEEFVLVLPGVNTAAAEKRAEEIRQKVAEFVVQQNDQTLSVTMSFGLATYPLHGEESEAVIIKADQAMYYAKRMGRNQVRVWDDQLIP